jgi:hypothetical protein
MRQGVKIGELYLGRGGGGEILLVFKSEQRNFL